MKMLKILTGLILACSPALAQNTIQYEIAFDNAAHHEAVVSLTIPAVPAGPLTVRMSRSSPGRYATHEFGKNVYDVKAYDGTKALAVRQTEGDVYQISVHGKTVKVTYTVFGNYVDGTYLAIDQSHAHLNMPATFMWAVGFERRPIEVRFKNIEKYGKIATQLKIVRAGVYAAPDLQYFMDSPVELSAYKSRSWTDVNTNGKIQTIGVSMHSADKQETVDAFSKMVERMVREAKAVFGELASYDYGTYTFLHDVSRDNHGDGMEHRNSTVITQTTPQVAGYEKQLIGTFSHEFFHSWNVERIRPKTLEPFNFSRANMSNELWFAEGFTQYYGELILTRAGIRDLDTYSITLSRLLNTVLNAPGAKYFSAPAMSRHAVFADAGVAVDQNNDANIFTSYYYYGAVIALGLDLRLRAEFNLTLDDYMRAVWKAHGKPEIPYTIPDLQNVLSKLTSAKFSSDFFSRYVNGLEKNDYTSLLAKAGMILRKAKPVTAWLGTLRLTPDANGLKITAPTLKGSPAYNAGLDNGNYLVELDGKKVTTAEEVDALLAGKKPGEKCSISYLPTMGAQQVVTTVNCQENTTLEVVPFEKAGVAINPAQAVFREKWLGTQLK